MRTRAERGQTVVEGGGLPQASALGCWRPVPSAPGTFITRKLQQPRARTVIVTAVARGREAGKIMADTSVRGGTLVCFFKDLCRK